MFVRMLKLPDEVARSSTTCRRCECVIHAAAPCPVAGEAADDRVVGPGDPRVLRRHRGQRLRLLQQREWLAHPGTVGTPIGCIVHIVDEDGEELPHGRDRHDLLRGRRARSSTTTTPRRRRPRATPKGWSTLGDVGYLDDDGYLYLTDRKAYMIISGGVNIYPQEAENVLVTHPKVVDVAVFGVPERRLRRGGQGGRAAGRRCRPTTTPRRRSSAS